MSILLDFIPFQILGGVGGAASFTKAVYDEFFRRTWLPMMQHFL